MIQLTLFQVVSWFFNAAAIAARIVPLKPLFSYRSLDADELLVRVVLKAIVVRIGYH